MTLTRQTPAQWSAVRTRIRKEISDPATRPNGSTIPSGTLRFQNSDILDAVNETLRFLGLKDMQIQSAPNLLSVDVTYSSDPVDLPDAIGGSDLIRKVEYISPSPTYGVNVDWVSHTEINDHAQVWGNARPYKFTLEALPLTGAPTDEYPKLRMRIRPSPATGQTFRVWYEAPPIIVGGDSDAHDFFGRWQDLIVLRSAFNILRRDSEMTEQQMTALAEYQRMYDKLGRTVRTPQRIRRARIGRA